MIIKNRMDTNEVKRSLAVVLLALVLGFACAVPARAQVPDYGTLIFNHQIAIGMTYGNVAAAWGDPLSVDRSYSSYGVTEYWFMKNGWMIVFERGRVVSFHQYLGGIR